MERRQGWTTPLRAKVFEKFDQPVSLLFGHRFVAHETVNAWRSRIIVASRNPVGVQPDGRTKIGHASA